MMEDNDKLAEMYIKKDTLSTRLSLHDKYSTNKYGWKNWVFDQYEFFEGITVLELACGTSEVWHGRNERLPINRKIILSDFSQLMVDKSKKLLGDENCFSFEQIDIQNIPYDNDCFDIVIANHMLYHVPNIRKALLEVYRVLKPNGVFYTTTLGKASMKELQDIYRKLENKASFTFSDNASFTLENGADLLGDYFNAVEQRNYIDSLQVTDINDIIDYIKSYNEIPDSINDKLFELVREGFSKDGIFYISKEQGMFVCRK